MCIFIDELESFSYQTFNSYLTNLEDNVIYMKLHKFKSNHNFDYWVHAISVVRITYNKFQFSLVWDEFKGNPLSTYLNRT